MVIYYNNFKGKHLAMFGPTFARPFGRSVISQSVEKKCSLFLVPVRTIHSVKVCLFHSLFLRPFRALANELGVKMSLETIIFLGCNLRLTFSLGSQEMMYNGTRTRHFRAL